MNKSIIRYILSRVLQFEAVFLVLPCLVALLYQEKTGYYFAIVAGIAFVVGTLGAAKKPSSNIFYAREGFVTVSLSWLLLSFVGAIPFYISGEIPSYIDALFETASGFTTTGATILTNVENMSQSAMFWRCFTHWVGGMGVLVFIMAILPLSGSYNMHLMRAESPGPDVGKLVPRVKNTAMILYGIYILITVTQFICLLIAGVDGFDALMITFSTTGTGGFLNKNASVGAYGSAVQIIVTVFMILCGINFNAYFFLIMRKPKEFFHMEEIRWYLGILGVAILTITLQIKDTYSNVWIALRDAAFQAASIMSTTGFITADYELWPMLSKAILMLLLMIGACAGSTGGGIKVSRIVILMRTIGKELAHLTHPRGVRKIRFDSHTVAEETVKSVQSYIIAYLGIAILSMIVVSIDNFDFASSVTSVLTCLGNVGPGLSTVGPTGNFAGFSALPKLVLVFDMLAGRLELFPMLVLFYLGTWKRN